MNPGPSSGRQTGDGGPSNNASGKKKKHRAGAKRKKNRRQSFATPSDPAIPDSNAHRPSLLDVPEHASTESQFYRLGARRESNTSLDSEALLDHRHHEEARPRRQSLLGLGNTKSNQGPGRHRPSHNGISRLTTHERNGKSYNHVPQEQHEHSEGEDTPTDNTPLMQENVRSTPRSRRHSGYGGMSGALRTRPDGRRPSNSSSKSRTKQRMPPRQQSSHSYMDDYDVNNPPSVPGSPRLGGDDAFDEVLLPTFRSSPSIRARDAVIDIDHDSNHTHSYSASPARLPDTGLRRRGTAQSPVEDVCVPFDQMTEIAEEDFMAQEGSEREPRRSRKRPWPDLMALEEWANDEKEARTMEGVRAKKVNEPEMVGGRLRPRRTPWQREEEEEATFRFTYFNEELDSSLRSYTISGLQQLGMSFRELFIPDPPELDDSSSDEDDDYHAPSVIHDRSETPVNGASRASTRQSSVLEPRRTEQQTNSGEHTPSKTRSSDTKPKRYGPRPVFWLDVLQPTYDEMRVISRAFGIHKLTAEDIMEQEQREKVELFRNYYFVNYRSFEQDETSSDHLEPVNMFFVVFKGGVISFHFNQMPHPPNVRRRIRQLAEHQYTDSDWISYAIIDNITDAYAPLIEQIEKEVDDIDDEILQLHSRQSSLEAEKALSKQESDKAGRPRSRSGAGLSKVLNVFKSSDPGGVYKRIGSMGLDQGADSSACSVNGSVTSPPKFNSGDMLLRVGECRKKVMGLYRLLGNKADVIKGLAKRCNEQWQVAPRSDVGLYLGDIQDHIVTMTGNLTHYENILSRAHSNYLAQINIKMTERAEQTNDVLGKLTVLGTIVLPMNIITGMWGMNVTVPGQFDEGNMWWFWGITAGLVAFGLTCFGAARVLYRVV